MTSLDDLKPGDDVWVINGHMNSVSAAKVRAVREYFVVTIPSKDPDQLFIFQRVTGNAAAGESFIVTYDDWRAQVLLARKDHLRKHQDVIAAAGAFQKTPNERTALALATATENWTDFVSESDVIALTATSLHEYLAKGPKGASYATRLAELGRA